MLARLRTALTRLGFVWSRQREDEHTRLEMQAHLDLLVERYIEQGLSPEEARRAARRQFGNVATTQRDVRDLNSVRLVEQAGQDLRYAYRQIRRAPGFAAVVMATLGLGIGATTAVFSVVQAVLLTPLPYDEPGQLVRFYQHRPGQPDTRDVLAGTHFAFLREHASSFEDVAALAHYSETGLDLSVNGRAERLRVLRVSSGYFPTLRAQPQLGRGFERDDETGVRKVVLSDAVWRTRYDASPSIVGSTVLLSAEPYEVVGIAPPGFEDPIAPDVAAWIPYNLVRDTYEENNSLTAIGRLRNGVGIARAQAELDGLSEPMRERWPAAVKSAILVTPLHEELVSTARTPLRLVFVAAALVLLIACVNVANLVLVRATGRTHELAVRAALGSSRLRLVRQLLVENTLLAALGGIAGLVVATVSVRGLQQLGQQALPRLDSIGPDPQVLLFALAATALSVVVFGVAPSLRLAGVHPADAFRQQSRSTTGGRGLARIRGALAAGQVALALALVAGAGVLLASFHRLQQVDPGIDAHGVLTFEVHLPTARYDVERRASFQEELARRLESLPGVRAAGGISRLPVTGSYHPWNAHIRTGPLAGTAVNRRGFALQQRTVSGDLFDALAIPLVAGRLFDDRDDASAPNRAVVSANFAKQAFPGLPHEAVLGQRIGVAGRDLDIIGVVGDVTLDVYGTPTMAVYQAHRQFAGNRNWALVQVVASDRATPDVLAAVRSEVAALDAELVVHRPTTMDDVLGRGAGRERFALVLMGAFAVAALALAGLGLYGMLAYTVRQRTTEIGIRLALGASARQVRGLVFRQAALVVGAGLIAGLAGALVIGRWLAALTFQISPSDPRVLGATMLAVSVLALVSAWLPARRAARVPPAVALHDTL